MTARAAVSQFWTDQHVEKGGRRFMHTVLLSAAHRREVCALIAAGCTLRQAARYLGCSVQRIAHTAQSNRGFARALRQAEMRFEVKCLRTIEAQMGKSWRAASWLLERRYPRRYGRSRKDAAAAVRPLLALLEERWQVESTVPDRITLQNPSP